MVLCVDSLEVIKLKVIRLRMELEALEERLSELEGLNDYTDLIDYDNIYDITDGKDNIIKWKM